ncbi:glycoside hydrolase family 108 protein [Flammeovirga sp. EKP202]|uniref:glycoside hydrolase family 108 protein n=1 Tax=Flammeovirga sp. EKP202 TaxID=2770592 RepID=UPI00165FDDAF|nr:putative peptidoglycan-binding domain-containing protein [Flammeovirga sp. EKP202]MBD0403222.1 hypothetical protein [Flammeovirga sp. EKP202]
MDAVFNKIYPKTITHEGYYAKVSGDIGGETYMGVARKYHPNWEGWKIVDFEKRKKGGRLPWNYRINNADLDQVVKGFYYKQFWLRRNLQHVKDANVAGLIFDFGVNAGGNAVKVLQRVLNEQFGQKLSVDGAIGPITLKSINSVNQQSLFQSYTNERVAYYKHRATYPNQSKFLKGWLKRAYSYVYDTAMNNKTLVTTSTLVMVGVGAYLFYQYYNNLS